MDMNISRDLCQEDAYRQSKPLEIYMFIDPLSTCCWGLEPVMKKLMVHYGSYFRFRHVIGGQFPKIVECTKKKYPDLAKSWERAGCLSGMSCDGDLWLEDPILAPYYLPIAIKAAELQGQTAGFRFLRRLQEVLFLEKQNVSKKHVLLDIASKVNLDVDEFKRDLSNSAAVKAVEFDLKMNAEMEVTETPTLVFFSQHLEEEGLKISGTYAYEVYVGIIEEMLGYTPLQAELPEIRTFLHTFPFVSTAEIATVYNLTTEEAEKWMKKLKLQGIVECVPVKHGYFWRYKNSTVAT
ncbi:ClpXP adapter SpxH family protein [Aureibacillus halotolerans]|uniref:ClpXP adapter protein SpxH n=1 Tax=Aureibacillus halotolerans TaxID=1508390 RepID=A0A4R6UB37_9BACI|nr:ClpXP adapter SpxH family protein [Aureibacillus halotolerans]TDQ42139.1 putative DsbA family dithiol-disulfide isomerase [Aureibacillus halotolerans]